MPESVNAESAPTFAHVNAETLRSGPLEGDTTICPALMLTCDLSNRPSAAISHITSYPGILETILDFPAMVTATTSRSLALLGLADAYQTCRPSGDQATPSSPCDSVVRRLALPFPSTRLPAQRTPSACSYAA